MARWLVVRRGRLRVVANLGPATARVPLDRRPASLLLASCPGVALCQDAVTMPATTLAVVGT